MDLYSPACLLQFLFYLLPLSVPAFHVRIVGQPPLLSSRLLTIPATLSLSFGPDSQTLDRIVAYLREVPCSTGFGSTENQECWAVPQLPPRLHVDSVSAISSLMSILLYIHLYGDICLIFSAFPEVHLFEYYAGEEFLDKAELERKHPGGYCRSAPCATTART